MNLDYQVKEKDVLSAFQRAPTIMTKALNTGLDVAAQKLVVAAQKKIESNKSFGTSDLMRSIGFKSGSRTSFLRTVFAGVKHGFYVENGSDGGGMPPREALTTWLRLKLRIDEADAKRLYWPVARSIKENGTKANPYMEPALAENERTLVQIIDDSIAKGVRQSFGVS